MKESILSMLRPCENCKKLTHNQDGFCDSCPTEPLEGVEDEDGNAATRD